MSSITATAGPFRYAKDIIWTIVWLGVLGASIWAIVYASMTWQRGIYAGFHYNDARRFAAEAMAKKYGWTFTKQMQLGTPDVVNTHAAGLMQGGQQVRIFHMVGPRGVKYCVTVWGGISSDVNSTASIEKGCRF